ncbi:hypothetical protein GCM10010172_79800 [Paractinoplanes ferrugineus]|uniref:Lipoprotein n=1 Tax=Paractinoplanes ferrugineus TaxID=113564 RepID=A0A919MFR8_9ACTN|nr:hypothetical protein [Actinoplanes ferrugineus]GIE13054.1 hypothetical protein Afe05nite_48940 [Actinoplanes ferrugineus]
MSRRIVARTATALAALSAGALSATGCSGPAHPTAEAMPSSAPWSPTAAPAPGSTAPGSAGSGSTGSGSGGSGSGGSAVKADPTLATAKTGPRWAEVVRECPYDDQPVVVQKVVRGDVNADGVPDSLVVRSCKPFTSYWASVVEIFDGTSHVSRPRRIGTLLTDAAEGPSVHELKVDRGIVDITAFGVDASTDNSCPNVVFRYRFRLAGKTWQTLRRTGDERFDDCPRIGS